MISITMTITFKLSFRMDLYLKQLWNLMDFTVTIVSKDTTHLFWIEITSSILQVFPIPSLTTSPKTKKRFIPKIEEVLGRLQFIPPRSILRLQKWEQIRIFISTSILHWDCTEFWEKEQKNHTLQSIFQEMGKL